MSNQNKAEQIESVCSAILDKEKVDPKHAEILIKRTEVQIKINNQIIGRVVETNGAFNFQYSVIKHRYMILSLKWTHKNDPWLTLWRTNSSGYCWFKEWAGLYDLQTARKNLDETQEKIIDTAFVKDLWKEVEYEGIKRMVLPNSEKVREAIGIGKRHLLKKYPS